jgi:hypothetical protein
LFFHNLAQKNFLGCCPVSAGEDELIRSIDLFCRIIGDNPKKFLSFFFSSSYRTEFFSPPCLVIFWPEDRGITRMVLLQNRNMRRRSAFFIIFLILLFEREKKKDKELFSSSSSSLGCWTLCFFVGSATRRCVLSSHLKKGKKSGKKGATSFD